jgi:hypothetical protein
MEEENIWNQDDIYQDKTGSVGSVGFLDIYFKYC